MMVLWEARELSVKELGDKLFLDSGTLTPLLKKLEAKGYLTRNRSVKDERNLIIKITDKGMALREEAIAVPQEIRSCISLTDDETAALFKLLHNFMSTIEQ